MLLLCLSHIFLKAEDPNPPFYEGCIPTSYDPLDYKVKWVYCSWNNVVIRCICDRNHSTECWPQWQVPCPPPE